MRIEPLFPLLHLSFFETSLRSSARCDTAPPGARQRTAPHHTPRFPTPRHATTCVLTYRAAPVCRSVGRSADGHNFASGKVGSPRRALSPLAIARRFTSRTSPQTHRRRCSLLLPGDLRDGESSERRHLACTQTLVRRRRDDVTAGVPTRIIPPR